MKKLIIGGAAIAVLGYLGVVGYLHQFDKENATQLLMENRYSPNTPLPFYSKFPIVGDEMQSDIQSGLRAFRLDRLLEGLKEPSKLSQADLAKLQRVLENNEMPIAKFRHLHWGSKPDEQEKVALLNWIREARKMSLPKETPMLMQIV